MNDAKIHMLYQLIEEAETNGNFQLAKRIEEELDELIESEDY